MGPGQDNARRHRADSDRLVLDLGNVGVGWPVVRHQLGLRGDRAEHEGVDLLLAEALDHLQPGAPWRTAVDFDRAGDQHFADPTAARRQDDRVVLGAEGNDRLIGLDDTAQRLALRVDHGPAQFGAQHPGGSVRAAAELTLQLEGRDVSPSDTQPRTTSSAAACASRARPAAQRLPGRHKRCRRCWHCHCGQCQKRHGAPFRAARARRRRFLTSRERGACLLTAYRSNRSNRSTRLPHPGAGS
jgi:hypothetical protein